MKRHEPIGRRNPFHRVCVAACLTCLISPARANEPPIADAGTSVYAGPDPVYLDGTGSYDPDASGLLQYQWSQTSGPELVLSNPTDAIPQISGPPRVSSRGATLIGDLPQTDEVQVCEFALTVSDGELESLPATVKLTIVPDLGGQSALTLENPPFDSNRPTVVYFGGGDCFKGGGAWSPADAPGWADQANIINFPIYEPDSQGEPRTYYHCGDLIMVYLSQVAPTYRQPIQTMGYSTGGQPAIDVGIRCNLTYRDRRYAINRVSLFEATGNCRSGYADSIDTFLASSVDGEQCWADNHVSTLLRVHDQVAYSGFHNNVLNIGYDVSLSSDLSRNELHDMPIAWYVNSLTNEDMNQFNGGVLGGAHWSVVGPGKNLQLASTPDSQVYRFKWFGDEHGGMMDFHDASNYPGRLPGPVKLVGPLDLGDLNLLLFTCEPSENAVGYELLFGTDPYRVMDYRVVSVTPTPPSHPVLWTSLTEPWWTVRARDAFGSTIYADPIPVRVGKFGK